MIHWLMWFNIFKYTETYVVIQDVNRSWVTRVFASLFKGIGSAQPQADIHGKQSAEATCQIQEKIIDLLRKSILSTQPI